MNGTGMDWSDKTQVATYKKLKALPVVLEKIPSVCTIVGCTKPAKHFLMREKMRVPGLCLPDEPGIWLCRPDFLAHKSV